MPGFAGSCGYYLKVYNRLNDKEYFSAGANNYWKDVDLYIGGTRAYARVFDLFEILE